MTTAADVDAAIAAVRAVDSGLALDAASVRR